MKYYWIAPTIEIKTASTTNKLCAFKMRGREQAAQQCKCWKRHCAATINLRTTCRGSASLNIIN